MSAIGTGDLFYELTVVEYLHPDITFESPDTVVVPALGRTTWTVTATVPEGSTATIGRLELSTPVPEGLEVMDTRLVREDKPGAGDEVRIETILTSTSTGAYRMQPIVLSYTIVPDGDIPAVTRRPSGVIEAYLDGVVFMVIEPPSLPSGFGGLAVLERLPLVVCKEVFTIVASSYVGHVMSLTVAIHPSVELEDAMVLRVVDTLPEGFRVLSGDDEMSSISDDGALVWETRAGVLPKTFVYSIGESGPAPAKSLVESRPAVVESDEGHVLGVSNIATFGSEGVVYRVQKRYSSVDVRAFEPVDVHLEVTTTMGGIPFAVVQDQVPPGFMLLEETIHRAGTDVVASTVSGSTVTFYIMHLTSTEITYSIAPVMQGRVVAPRARVYPLFSPHNEALSDSGILLVRPAEDSTTPPKEAPTGGSPGVDGQPYFAAPDVRLLVPLQGFDSREHITGVAETIHATVHNPTETTVVVPVVLVDRNVGSLWRGNVTLSPGQTVQVQITWTPEVGGHLLYVAAGGETVDLPAIYLDEDNAPRTETAPSTSPWDLPWGVTLLAIGCMVLLAMITAMMLVVGRRLLRRSRNRREPGRKR